MQDVNGKTAFITGGANGIGFGMAEAMAKAGMNVMIADIERAALQTAVDRLSANGFTVHGVECDVADRGSVREAADRTLATFGKVHVVCNNAGVGIDAPMENISEGDWRWIIGVNLMGVIHGTEIFTPLIKLHGEGGHFVNTSSLAGLFSMMNGEPYAATKAAIIAMSEGWVLQLEPFNIGVSVLMPGLVQSRLMDSRRNRSAAYGSQFTTDKETPETDRQALDEGMPAVVVGERVLEAIRNNELFVTTHPEFRPLFEARVARILEGFDNAQESAVLSKLPSRSLPQLVMRRFADK